MTERTRARRLPDFVVIGAMKAGTTSLYRWLRDQPEVFLPHLKEVDFFPKDERWESGLAWYESLFKEAREDQLLGEVSGACTCPRLAQKSATRMAQVIPRSLLVYVVRDPIERLRSHYRHQVQRGRERRSLHEACLDPENDYIGYSLYFQNLVPYMRYFERDRIFVVRSEDLFEDSVKGWGELVARLRLSDRPKPLVRYNVTNSKDQFSRALLWLWKSGMLDQFPNFPRPIRKLGKRMLTHRGGRYEARLSEADAPIPDGVRSTIRSDVRQLEQWLGVEALWSAGTSHEVKQPGSSERVQHKTE
jgi:hypothetical protein